MAEELKLDLMKKFKELNVVEYTTKYGDYYGLMFAGAEIATKELQKENAELKAKVGLSIDCEKAQKNGELCLGYGGDEDEPCERCKNCIKCEGGYYQLGETEKDDTIVDLKSKVSEANSNAVIWTEELAAENKYLTKQIEEMKSDVKGNLRFAEHSNNEIMRQKMCSMLLQWEAKHNKIADEVEQDIKEQKVLYGLLYSKTNR